MFNSYCLTLGYFKCPSVSKMTEYEYDSLGCKTVLKHILCFRSQLFCESSNTPTNIANKHENKVSFVFLLSICMFFNVFVTAFQVSSFKLYLSHTRLYRDCITSSEMCILFALTDVLV